MSRQHLKKEKKPEHRYFKVKIEDLNEKGDGIAYYQGKKINVRKTLPGEEAFVAYLPGRPRKDRIHLVKRLSDSPQRVQPPCPYFMDCGGCHLQHLQYENQLLQKEKLIKKLLLPYPELKKIAVQPVAGMPRPFHYRNKTQMPFQRSADRIVYGLYRKGTHELLPIDTCPVESKDANRALQIIKDWAVRFNIEPYDEIRHQGILRHAVIRKGQFTNQVMVAVVATSRDLPYWKHLVQALKEGLPSLRSVILNINSLKTNVVLGPENIVLWGDPFIEEQLGRVRFRIYPGTFFQTNSVQMIRLLEKMGALLQLRKTDRILDLYSGVGTIGLYLADSVDRVLGLDDNADAIESAVQNANDNEIWNASFGVADLQEGFRMAMEDSFQPTIVIVDPPRKGLSEKTIGDIVTLKPEKVVYVSCNPKTLVRDLRLFYQADYRAEEIFPFDMFPHTAHVESLVVLRLAEKGR